jgi:hypothetical protein
MDKIAEWKSVWLVPAGIAGFVLIIFLLFFKESNDQSGA